MKTVLPYVVIGSSCFFSACGTTGSDSEITLQDLQRDEPSQITISETRINDNRVTRLYRDFLRMNKGHFKRSDVMRRLADLQLDKAETSPGRNSQDVKESIRLYTAFLSTYPSHPDSDYIMYQLARAYELDGEPQRVVTTLEELLRRFPSSDFRYEAYFRKGETLFMLGRYSEAESSYAQLINKPDSHYHATAIYKYGWSQFKQGDYNHSLLTFTSILDDRQKKGIIDESANITTTSASEKEIIDDVLRVISLCFSYQQGHQSINQFFSSKGHRSYEPLIYRNLAEHYAKKDRVRDAALTYLSYTERYPYAETAPEFHQQAINAFRKGGFNLEVLQSKISFTRKYAVNSLFWNRQSQQTRERVSPQLQKHLYDLATHYHALARKSAFDNDYDQASHFYRSFIDSFPSDRRSAEMNFLLAECYQEQKKYRQAITEFEKTAYHYPQHTKKAEAAYAALLLYPLVEKTLKSNEKIRWTQQQVENSLRFTQSFPGHKQVDSILTKTAERLYAMGDFQRASIAAEKVINSSKKNQLVTTSLFIFGHSQFESGNYLAAEKTYQRLLKRLRPNHQHYKDIKEKLAASLYKQAELASKNQDHQAAAALFMAVSRRSSGTRLAASAEYDAATSYIRAKQWIKAEKILLGFRKRHTKATKLQQGVTEKLILIYQQTDQPSRQAKQLEILAYTASEGYDRKQRAELLWNAIDLFNQTGQHKKSLAALNRYINSYATSREGQLEAYLLLSEIYRKQNNSRALASSLDKIISLDKTAGAQRTVRTRQVAATATLQLAQPVLKQYLATRLSLPLRKSLQRKKVLMEKCVRYYQQAIDYRVASVTTEATYQLAEIYHDLAKSLLKSDKPRGLNADELEQYTVLLEEQSYPFEEKAIDIHTANAERVKDGFYDSWIAKSITALASLNPVRYAKTEKVENYVASIN